MHVLLATEQPDLRLALEMLLGEEPGVVVVGGVSEAEGLLALVRITLPDLVLLDWDLPGRPLPGVLAESFALSRPPRFIVLGRDLRARQVAIDAGADAFVIKGDSPNQLLAAFREVRAGRSREVAGS